VIVAHVMGLPVEEGLIQFGSAGVALITTVALAGRTSLGKLRRRLRHRSRTVDH
jgi:hypothetical protein